MSQLQKWIFRWKKIIACKNVCFLIALWIPLSSFALGVGQIHIKSHLNEPLDAVIPLRHLADLKDNQITVSIAENSFFDKRGIYRAPCLSELQLSVSHAEIQLSTFKAIHDPVVEILLNIVWPTGQIIRQYTLFLDPQEIETTATIKMVSSNNPERQTFFAQLSKSKDSNKGKNWGDAYGQVTEKDTLWKIAYDLVSGTSYTVSQGVIAIYQKNMNAFKNQNINQLLIGSHLQLPTVEEIDSLSPKQAMEKIALHTKQSQDFIYNLNKTNENITSDNFLLQKPLRILSVIEKT